MVGEEYMEEVIAYLSRLTGENISADQAFRLRSIHRAAFASWARKQNVPIRLDVMNSGTPATVRALLDSVEDAPATIPQPAQPLKVVNHPSNPFTGIGIDIEEIDNLPQAGDYREHPFFQDHFTNAEIAYCIQQVDVRASFCGIWAAKEALLKTGLIPSSSRHLNEFEIFRDEAGRPLFPGCNLSISHTSKTAVAVCVATAVTPLVQRTAVAPAPPVELTPSTVTRGRRKWAWFR
jgi:phosphopantetheine--protein transferase-like protein